MPMEGGLKAIFERLSHLRVHCAFTGEPQILFC